MQIAKNFFEMMYYHIYKSILRSDNGNVPRAMGSAIPVIAFIQIINIYDTLLLMDIVGLNFLTDYFINASTASNILAIVGLIVANLFYFDEYKRRGIIKKFSKKPLIERKRGAKITLLYGLGSIILIFILAPLRVV